MNLGISGTPAIEEDWTLDALGNWPSYAHKTSGATDLNQTRTHDLANELTQINSSNTHVAEDGAGNMTKLPKPSSWSAHYDLSFDAWNRLVGVADTGRHGGRVRIRRPELPHDQADLHGRLAFGDAALLGPERTGKGDITDIQEARPRGK